MAYEIKHFSEEEQRAFKEQHDLAEPKEWAVMDDGIVFNFYDIEEEAKARLAELEQGENIMDAFDDWVARYSEATAIGQDEVRQVVREQL